MTAIPQSVLARVLAEQEAPLLEEWLAHQTGAGSFHPGRISVAALRDDSTKFLALLRGAAATGLDERAAGWGEVRGFLSGLSRTRAKAGISPSETATFVFSLKQALFNRLRAAGTGQSGEDEVWQASLLLDRLGLLTFETFVQGREEVIIRQQQEMMELSTPVVTLWEGILVLPLIGTLDSARTQVVMENLLQRIVDTSAAIAIVDITGVPMVDTLVAQHLLKTVAAARLMGADCIISGIRPQIAQTIVHLGVTLTDVITKATIADAFAVALHKTGRRVAEQVRV